MCTIKRLPSKNLDIETFRKCGRLVIVREIELAVEEHSDDRVDNGRIFERIIRRDADDDVCVARACSVEEPVKDVVLVPAETVDPFLLRPRFQCGVCRIHRSGEDGFFDQL